MTFPNKRAPLSYPRVILHFATAAIPNALYIAAILSLQYLSFRHAAILSMIRHNVESKKYGDSLLVEYN